MNFTNVSRTLLVAVVLVLTAFHSWLIFASPYLNHDVAQYLSAGQKIAKGGLPYLDIIDTNPPAILYMSVVPALVARTLHLSLTETGLVYWAAVVLGTIGFITWLTRRAFPRMSLEEILFIAGIWITTSILVYAHRDFAQRDHLIVLFLGAMFLVRYVRYEGTPIPLPASIVAGIAAGFAAAMKPHYFLLIIAIEVLFRFWFGKFLFRPQHAELVTLAVTFVALVVTPVIVPATSESSLYWIGRIARGYTVYNTVKVEYILRMIFSDPWMLFWLIVSLSLSWLALIRVSNDRFKGASLYGIVALVSLLLVILQHKGWTYHLIPCFVAAAVGLGYLVSDLARFLSNGYRSMVIVCGGVLLLPMSFLNPEVRTMAEDTMKQPVWVFAYNNFTEIIMTLTRRDESVLFISSSVLPAYPAITYAERNPAGRFLSAFPVAFMYNPSEGYHISPQWQDDEPRYLSMLIEDVRRDQPKMIAVSFEKNVQALPSYFRIGEYLRMRGFYDSLGTDYRAVGCFMEFEILIRGDKDHRGEELDSLESVQLLRRRGLLTPAPNCP
jgi:hypothetical protein